MVKFSITDSELSRLGDIINEAEYMKYSYFWSPKGNASYRRWYESKHSHDVVRWEERGQKYSASFKVSCSCRNIYASGDYYRDGKRTTLTAIRNSYNRMMEEKNKVATDENQGVGEDEKKDTEATAK